jgi:hypothetical protein
MISNSEISKWKIATGWHNFTPNVIGHGFISHPYIPGKIQGSLVELTNENGYSRHLFIADEPVIDHDNLIEDKYFFHEGIFVDGMANGRCWFISIATLHDNIISTNHDGVFTKCECFRGLIV